MLLGTEVDARILVLFLFGILIAATMLWSLIPRRDKFEAPGMRLDRSTQPRLFAELENIAAALDEPMPQEVYLIGAANAFVADRGGVMGFGSRRVMGLGLPLLYLLTVSQFRAVLAHEFAHYYGGDTSLGPWVYKTKASIVRIFENIGSVGQLARMAILGVMYMAVTWLLKGYFIAFLRAINFVSRRQEYRADELACIVAGRQNLIAGLKAIHRAAVAWPVFWKDEVVPHLGDGSLVALGDGFARFVSVPEVSPRRSERTCPPGCKKRRWGPTIRTRHCATASPRPKKWTSVPPRKMLGLPALFSRTCRPPKSISSNTPFLISRAVACNTLAGTTSRCVS